MHFSAGVKFLALLLYLIAGYTLMILAYDGFMPVWVAFAIVIPVGILIGQFVFSGHRKR